VDLYDELLAIAHNTGALAILAFTAAICIWIHLDTRRS
jgi:hypothetical protein